MTLPEVYCEMRSYGYIDDGESFRDEMEEWAIVGTQAKHTRFNSKLALKRPRRRVVVRDNAS